MTGKILTFYLGGELFGVDIKLVKEINRKIRYTRVAGAPDFIVGLFNMRGQVVTVFDIACRIHGMESIIPENPTCIILKTQNENSEHMGFVVDRPGDVLDILDEWCEPLIGNMEHEYGEYIKEIVKFQDHLIMIIDPDRIFE
jgi:purine-binding chemotaxis protein CheW